jgi:hypothetical protein
MSGGDQEDSVDTTRLPRVNQSHQPTYRSHLYVCGAIGRADPRALARLVAASPGGVQQILDEEKATLWATSTPSRWKDRDRRGFHWNALARGSSPKDWRAASEQRIAAGLQIDRHAVTLHADVLGASEMYTRRLGDALYFSSRIHPLTRLDETGLHQDEAAWTNILALGSPLADETPFEEVRRLAAASAWTATDDGLRLVSFEPAWMRVEPDPRSDPAAVADMLERRLPRRIPLRRLSLTFSGGWDSRLLASLAVRASRRRVIAWTTDPDNGFQLDVELSRPVAKALGLEQRILIPPPRAWVRNAPIVRQRVQHQTPMHTWIMPLARTLHDRREPLLDGLAGDVLLKSLFVDHAVLEAADIREALWESLAGGRLSNERLLARGLTADMEESSRAAFKKATAQFTGHPAAATLSVLGTRTVRAVAPSPMLLFAPEVDVRLPFVHPEVITAALTVPLDRKLGGGFYRQVLEAANSDVAKLPSTNDDLPKPPPGARRQTSAPALMSMARLIRSDDDVCRLLSPLVRRALRDRDSMAQVTAEPRLVDVLQWGAMMAEWRSIYGDVLTA